MGSRASRNSRRSDRVRWAGEAVTLPTVPSLDELDAEPGTAGGLPLAATTALLARCTRVHGILVAHVLEVAGHGSGAPQAAGEDRLLDVREAAQRLGVSTGTLYRQASQMPFALRVGRSLRFSSQGLDRAHPPALRRSALGTAGRRMKTSPSERDELAGRGYLTPEQLADLLQVSTKSIYRWAIEDPTMPCLRIGGRTLRFPHARLLAWLRAREQGHGRPRRFSEPVSHARQAHVESALGGNGTDAWAHS